MMIAATESRETEHGGSGEIEERAPERFEPRYRLDQDRPHVGRGEGPQLIHLLPDQRPTLDGVSGHRNEGNVRFQFPDGEFDGADQAHTEPGHRTDDDHQAQHGDRHRRQPAAADAPGEPIVERVERDGEDRAPQRDQHKRADHVERPIEEKPEEPDADHRIDRQQSCDRRPVLVGGHRLFRSSSRFSARRARRIYSARRSLGGRSIDMIGGGVSTDRSYPWPQVAAKPRVRPSFPAARRPDIGSTRHAASDPLAPRVVTIGPDTTVGPAAASRLPALPPRRTTPARRGGRPSSSPDRGG